MGRQGLLALAAAALLCTVLGSVHAFSVFLEPLEARFEVSRATASLTYSFALVALTVVVLLGPQIYARFSATTILGTAAVLAALGAGFAAAGPTIGMIWLGYSLLFGAANGLGYGYGLQLAAHANPGREGLAMGTVTASYAVGATLAPLAFVAALEAGGFPLAMTGLACCLLLAGLGAVGLLRRTGLALPVSAPTTGTPKTKANIPIIWFAYGTGVFAGLMIIGHAAEIARTGEQAALWLAPVLIALFNMAGSLIAGSLVDRLPSKGLLIAIPLAGAGGVLLALGSDTTVLPALAIVGFCYGALIATYPAVLAKRFGMAEGPRIYGRVFTAWGVAGLAGPWLAGALFDATGTYTPALWTAAALAITSAVVAGTAMQRTL
ncbi:MAG: MFS transporter [Paracoccaceae bacterium]